MGSKFLVKWVSTLTTASLLFSGVATVFGAGASARSDIGGHWAERQIIEWQDYGLIKGYDDGTFRPDNFITRAEFATLVNRSFGFTAAGEGTFKDINPASYAYEQAAIAMEAGYMEGYEDGSFGANRPISREEAAAIVSRLLNLTKSDYSGSFSDGDDISPWARDAVNGTAELRIFTGYDDGSFRPDGNIERGEAVAVLDRVLDVRVISFDEGGTFGPDKGVKTIYGNVVINVPDVTLQNTVIYGDVTFAEGIGSGDATLRHVTVKGNTKVAGGGDHSIHLIDSVLLTVVVDKKNGSVRIVAEGATSTGELTVNTPATIEEDGTTGNGFGEVTLTDLLPEGSKITLIGSFEKATVQGEQLQIDIPQGSVEELITDADAKGLNLNLGSEATIVQLVLNAAAKVLGKGLIEKAIVSESARPGTSFEKPPVVTEGEGGATPAPTTAPTVAPTPAPTATPTATATATTEPSATPIAQLSIVDFGATSNDETDDLQAIKDTVAAAKEQGASVYVPSGEFLFSDVVVLDGVDLKGDGETSILKSTNLRYQSIILTGDGADLSGVLLTSVPATDRLTNNDSARVQVNRQAVNYSIQNIIIDGGSSVGFYNAGTNGIIRGNTVRNMLADGIHITELSNNILVENNTVTNVGDDFIAVVSYEKFGGWVKNVVVRNNQVSEGHARGLAVSGGENVLIENNTVSNVYGAGIYLSSEGNYKTYTVKDVTVRNNTVTNDSTNGGSPTKGGLNITATNLTPSLDNVLVENNTFIDSQDNGMLIAGSKEIAGVQIKNNTITNPKNNGILIVKTVIGEIDFAGNTVTDQGKVVYANYSRDVRVTSDLTNEAVPEEDKERPLAAYGTPAIDGEVDELWENATVIQMNTAATGMTGTAQIAWDDSALYYLFHMADNTPHAVSEKEKNDSVEVWVDELNMKNGAMGIGDYQMRIDRNNAQTTVMKTWDWTGITNFVKEIDGGYTVEFKVPYRELVPEAGYIIGFNASANDDSDGDGKRNGFSSWVDPSLQYWASTAVYNEVELAAAPVAPLSIVDFGATPNDETDDLQAIKDTVAAAKEQGASVYVPSGEFLFSDVFVLDGVDLKGDGETSILKSVNLTRQAIVLSGEGPDLSGVKLTSVPATVRLTNDDSARIRVAPSANHYSITNVVIDGGSSVGFFNAGTNGVISGNTVRNMLADGIHITALSSDILIENNIVTHVGDDFIAVVSYEKYGGWVKNVVIRNNQVSFGEARGLTVSGGENVLIENNTVSDVFGAGIYLSSEGNYKTYTVKDVIVRNNTVTNDSTNGGSPTKGGLNITATNLTPSLDNVLVENNTFIDSQDNGMLIAGAKEVVGVKIQNNTITNPKNHGILVVKTVIGEIDFEGNTVTDQGEVVYANYSDDARITSDLTNEAEEEDDTERPVAAYGTPEIDGEMDGLWAGSSVLQMDNAATGMTGSARIAWDESALYFLFEVQDDTPFAVSEKEKNDSVEVWVDELNTKNGAMTVGDYQMRVDRNNALTTVMKTWSWTGITSFVKETGGGYIVEFKVPYRELTPEAGNIIGFNASANDDSNGDGLRNGFSTWVNRNLPYWADTKVYNEVVLAGPSED